MIVDEEVADALAARRAVVALESSLIANGLPHPHGVETGLAAAAAVRAAGAVPATIALIGGTVRVGIGAAEMARLAETGAAKCAARDIAAVRVSGGDGGTTVSATARIAGAAGIRLFATGGIGGVHRRLAADPSAVFDVSADLPELARAAVAVVSSGAKAVLDLPATLEVLETLGVPVAGLGTGRLPAFYAADSGLETPHRVADPAAAAGFASAHWSLPGAGGVLICNPPPTDVAMDSARQAELVERALSAARTAGVSGPAVTPFLLGEMRRLSGDETLTINKALVVGNARAAAEIAVALCELPD